MTKGRSSKDIAAKAYNEVVHSAYLEGIRLLKTEFEIKPSALDEDRDSWSYRIGSKIGEVQLDEEEPFFRGFFMFEVSCQHGRSKPVKLVAHYMATFETSGPCEKEAAQAYLGRVGRYTCYPYFRSLFAVLTEQSGLMLPPLPTMKEKREVR